MKLVDTVVRDGGRRRTEARPIRGGQDERRQAKDARQVPRRAHEGFGASELGSGLTVVSPDGEVAFSLSIVGDRLFVQRTHRKEAGVVAVQCLLITELEDFRRWCEVEPTRFDHPVVFDRVRRFGNEVFDSRQ